MELELCEKKMREEIIWFVRKEIWFNDSGEVTRITYKNGNNKDAVVFSKSEKTWVVYLGDCEDLMPDDLSILSDMLELFNRRSAIWNSQGGD